MSKLLAGKKKLEKPGVKPNTEQVAILPIEVRTENEMQVWHAKHNLCDLLQNLLDLPKKKQSFKDVSLAYDRVWVYIKCLFIIVLSRDTLP